MKKLVLTLDKNSDKRKRKRIEIFSNISGQLDILGVSTKARIKDISYSGFGIIVPNDDRLSTMETLEAQLALSNQLFKGRIANRILLPNSQVKLGISLPAQIHREIDFNNIDSSWDKVTDPETVKNIYSDLAYKGPEAPIEIRQNFSKTKVLPLELTSSDSIICEIMEVVHGSLEKGKAKCMFDLFQTCHAFDSNVERFDNTKIEIKTSGTLARLLRRETVRVKNQSSNYEISVLLRSKSLDKEITKFKIFDYSEQGLSLLDPEGELSLPRNLLFEEIIIEIKNIGSIFGFGEVRSYEWSRDLKTYIIGLMFKPYGEPHLTNWHNFILKARYPTLDFEYKEEDHLKIWQLFEKSGYLGLKPKESFDIVYDVTRKTWRNLRDAGTDISKRIKIVNGDEIVGHIQIDKIYPKTWCVHHLSIDPKISKVVGKEIYSVTTDVILAEGGEYLLSLTEAAKPWNQRVYYDFVTNYRFPEHNLTKKLQVYEVDIQKPVRDFISQYEIRQANKWDLKKIVRFFETHLTKLEIEACGLTQQNITLTKLTADFAKLKLEREREFIVAVDDNDDLLGFARIETGTTGVNIFGLLDILYIYSPVENLEIKGKIFDALIFKSLKIYQAKGKKDVILVLEDNRVDHYKEFGFIFIWEGILWIAKKDILPRYHAYTQLLYSHLILRREKNKKKNADRKN